MGLALPGSVALTAWLALNPYFLWGTSTPLLLASVFVAIIAAVTFWNGARPESRLEVAGVLVLSAYLVYITLLPKTDGGHIKWVYVLPTLWAMVVMTSHERRRCLDLFAGIFAITLIPGVVVSALAVAGAPLSFRTGMTMPVIGSPILELPGALFIATNSVILPWGGVLFRMCAIYDEPGTVGTVSASLLAAYGYKLGWRTNILYVAGLLSFSLAFIVLTVAGLAVAAVWRWRCALAAVPLVLCVPVLVGAVDFGVPLGRASNLSAGTERFVATDDKGRHLRQVRSLDNRVTPQMAAVWERYLYSGPSTLLFGVASDASVVGGNISQTWRRILTDSGLVGCVLYAASLLLIALCRWRAASDRLAMTAFLTLYAASLYQRPVFWLPYTLVILFCASPLLASRAQERLRPSSQ